MAEPYAPHVNDQRAALLGVLADLSSEDWRRPTICAPWTIHDLVAHLVEGELLFGRVYRGEIDEVFTDNQEGVDRWATVDAETVRYSLWHHGQATQRVIDSRSEASWDREVTNRGWPIELRRALRMHFFELAVHGHDVTRALGAPTIWGERAAPLVDYCIELAPLTMTMVPPAGAVELDVSDAGGWTLDASSGEWLASARPAADPVATWHTDPETLVLACTGRLDLGEAVERTKVEGDAALIGTILKAWQIAG